MEKEFYDFLTAKNLISRHKGKVLRFFRTKIQDSEITLQIEIGPKEIKNIILSESSLLSTDSLNLKILNEFYFKQLKTKKFRYVKDISYCPEVSLTLSLLGEIVRSFIKALIVSKPMDKVFGEDLKLSQFPGENLLFELNNSNYEKLFKDQCPGIVFNCEVLVQKRSDSLKLKILGRKSDMIQFDSPEEITELKLTISPYDNLTEKLKNLVDQYINSIGSLSFSHGSLSSYNPNYN